MNAVIYKIVNFYFINIFLLLLSSCAGNLLITPVALKNKIPLSIERNLRHAHYSRHQYIDNFSFKKEIWLPIPGVSRKIRLLDLLREANIDPLKIEHMSYSIETDWGDALRNLFPFIGAKTILIRGYSSQFELLKLSQ